ncbi:PC-esterase domain-containing protein 1A [Hippocampus zosterae]|uniref:PC-esterase domain-containing protein 1A n=1 Tax=Hippocampus zosterae TaxID=109293 RepID=UPI00223CD668|nr:PC-esterase domain-containing protein 1A [Hippocampus zosterae]XP_051923404.1 PC-esterase domain-containing protein 1A [Hippocampus zosterae]
MKFISHQLVSQLFHNKFIVVLGDSIQRSIYKDLVVLLQKDEYLHAAQLKRKGEMSFEQDFLVEGGCLSQMHNGTGYREVRQYQSPHHLVRFYFVTRIYSDYMKSVMEDFRHGLKPDLVIVNSCVWDISRYHSKWVDGYKDNLNRFFEELLGILPEECLVIWNLTMPLGERINGGFLVPEISHMASHLRHDVIEANFYSGVLAEAFKVDVLDLHFHFRFSLQHRTKDGIHWNALAHRQISTLLSLHAADAWGVELPLRSLVDFSVACPPQGSESTGNQRDARPQRITWSPRPRHRGLTDFEAHPPPSWDERAADHTPYSHRGSLPNDYNGPYVMRTRRTRYHYMPYTHRRSNYHY